ncbi:hypothetical protein HY969_00620 [Candidatus Kaiserbacteria bacterium]|nr:hypothetical protein [Candidatus Kaiserbacteria bacterium]
MQDDTKKILEEQFAALPKAVQDAITSGHIEEKFQKMAEKYKLHLDQWQQVENLIMLTVLGLSEPENLVEKIVSETNIGRERADDIVNDVAVTVFKPIREELERELGHPQAKEEQFSDVEKLRNNVLSSEKKDITPSAKIPQDAPVPANPVPATPPALKPDEKVTRAPASGAYKPGEASSIRADVHDDPYREPPK